MLNIKKKKIKAVKEDKPFTTRNLKYLKNKNNFLVQF